MAISILQISICSIFKFRISILLFRVSIIEFANFRIFIYLNFRISHFRISNFQFLLIFNHQVVSTSSTPGHTKHFQTIYINLSDENGVTSQFKLCDCPGLVFPAVDISKELQVLSGVFPISQVFYTLCL